MNTSFQLPSRVFFNISVRNAPDEVRQCLLSLASQGCRDWHGCITDDASDDGTAKIIEALVRQESLPLQVRCNRVRRWKSANFIAALELAGPSDIVVELDGDDSLTSGDFIQEIVRLHKTYDSVWTQYENETSRYPEFIELFSKSTRLCSRQWNRRSSGDSLWDLAHGLPGAVRTFKAAYFDTIPDEYLKLEGSEDLVLAFDGAYYTAILERTHPTLRYFYDRVFLRRHLTGENVFFAERSGENLRNQNQNYELIHRYLRSLTPLSILEPVHRVAVITPDDLSKWRSAMENRAAENHFEVFAYPESFFEDLITRPQFALHVTLYNLERLLESDYPFYDVNVSVESMKAFEKIRDDLGPACVDLIRRLKPADDIRMMD